jgi:hypothetical protein
MAQKTKEFGLIGTGRIVMKGVRQNFKKSPWSATIDMQGLDTCALFENLLLRPKSNLEHLEKRKSCQSGEDMPC